MRQSISIQSARHRFHNHLWGAGAFAAMIVLLAFPAVTRADCGGIVIAQPASHPRGQLPPLAIGDSTMLLSLPGLAARGYVVNAQGCRQFYQALMLLGQLRARRALPHLVVIALGANGYVTRRNIGVALWLLGVTRELALVTPRQLGGASGENAAVEHDMARKHPRRIVLLDWVRYSAGHPYWFQPDGLHLTWPGVAAFTRLLGRAIPHAYPAPKRHKRKHRTPLATAGSAADPRADQPPLGGVPLALSATLDRVGYVGATITGAPGTSVQLSEERAGTTAPIAVVTLPASGTAIVPRALTWLCDLRVRVLVADTLPPAAPATATTTVTTRSCSRRLVTVIDRHERAGSAIAIRLRDRWGLGGLALRICLTPPGGRRKCGAWRLRQGRRSRVVHIRAPRPGGWLTTLQTRYGYEKRAVVWASHPGGRIRLLAAGDSEMQILDGFLAQDLVGHGVEVTNDARVSTGLTSPFFFDWPNHARQQAPTLRPDVTVFFMGANDGFAVSGKGGRQAACCGAAWSAGYANLVAEMMRIYLRGNAGRVYWFLLPAPLPARFQELFNAVNAGIREAAKRFPGRVSLIDANAFFTPGNRYRDHMVYDGRGFVIHQADGIHLSTASDAIDAAIVTRRLLADRVIP